MHLPYRKYTFAGSPADRQYVGIARSVGNLKHLRSAATSCDCLSFILLCLCMSECAGQVTECDGQVTECDGQVTECDSQVTECDGQVTKCDSQVTECDGQVTKCDSQVTECDGQVTDLAM